MTSEQLTEFPGHAPPSRAINAEPLHVAMRKSYVLDVPFAVHRQQAEAVHVNVPSTVGEPLDYALALVRQKYGEQVDVAGFTRRRAHHPRWTRLTIWIWPETNLTRGGPR